MIKSATSHSSVVTLELLVGDRQIPLVQMSREFLVSQNPSESFKQVRANRN